MPARDAASGPDAQSAVSTQHSDDSIAVNRRAAPGTSGIRTTAAFDKFSAVAVDEFRAYLAAMADRDEITDLSPDAARQAAATAADAVKRATHLKDRLGTFYDTQRVCQLLGASRQAVHDRVTNHRLLRARTSDGVYVYPAFQFLPDGDVHPQIAKVVQILLEHGDPWTVTYWLTAKVADLGGRTPAEMLASDSTADIDHVYQLARVDAAAWASQGPKPLTVQE